MIKCTTERNIQILIGVLKANNIKKIIISPGTTNASFVVSIQSDPFFEVFSAPEERSAAYMACGMAAESGEIVVLSCTGATASRNYMPALTEAFYRQLPILVVTSSRRNAFIGHNMHQVTDRTQLPKDIANMSVQMPVVLDEISEWQNTIAANKAVLQLKNLGGGPVHINIETIYSKEVSTDVKEVNIIERIGYEDSFPVIPEDNKIAIFVGNHMPFDEKLTEAIDMFCGTYNAVVLCDHTSNYKGKYRVCASLLYIQNHFKSCIYDLDLLIHIGGVSTVDLNINPKKVWRVNPDGQLIDTFLKLSCVFAMSELNFFLKYASKDKDNDALLVNCQNELQMLYNNMTDFPFSSLWMAKETAHRIPNHSAIHFAIRNSLKTWNYFELPDDVTEFSNTGGFGIDGPISTVVGAALVNPDKLFFLVVGDLAFFYDINVFGNRHFPDNIRILLVNNAIGFEMHGECTLGHQIAKSFELSDDYIAAAGHYGQRKNEAAKRFVEEFGCEYYLAKNKDEYLEHIEHFLDSEYREKSIVLETHVLPSDEDAAYEMTRNLVYDKASGTKKKVKDLLGDANYKRLSGIYNKIRKE